MKGGTITKRITLAAAALFMLLAAIFGIGALARTEVKADDPAYDLAETVSITAGWNHVDKLGAKAFVFHAYPAGSSTPINTNWDFEGGESFISSLELDGASTNIFSYPKSGGNNSNGGAYIDIRYATTALGETEHTLTIPQGATHYNIKFNKEINFYFYETNGTWQWNLLPKPVATTVNRIAINEGHNHNVRTAGTSHYLVIHGYAGEGGDAIKLDTRMAEGTLFTTGTGATINHGYMGTVSKHSSNANNASPVYLEYTDDGTFFDEIGYPDYAVMTIPEGTTFYNLTFGKEFKLYFFNGKWHLDEPPAVSSVNSIAINPSNNHVEMSGNKHFLVLHGYQGENGSGSAIALQKNVPSGTLFTSTGLSIDHSYAGTITEDTTRNISNASPIYIDYTDEETFFTGATYRNYLTMTIPEGATFYNLKFAKEFKLYFYGGKWTLTQPEAEASIAGYTIGVPNNHVASADKYTVLVNFKDGESTNVNMNTAYAAEDDFASKAKINGNALSDYGFALSSKTTNGSANVYFEYGKEAWDDAAENGMLTLTIPADTTLKNFRFTGEVKLYFYNGMWMTEPVKSAPATYQQATGIRVHATVNNAAWTGHDGYKNVILYLTGTSGDVTTDRTYPVGDFFDSVVFSGTGVSFELGHRVGHMVTGGAFALNGTLLCVVYNEAECLQSPAKYLTLTIPQGTKLYDAEFANEVKLYFGTDGKWQLDRPYDAEIDEMTEVNAVAIHASLNHDGNETKELVLYVQKSVGAGNEVLYTRYPAGNFFSVITLDGETTDKFSIRLGTHSGNGQSPIDIIYSQDDALWAVTTESYKVLTIPKDATLYNIKFAAEMKLYFYNGKWQLDRPYDSAIDVTTEATGVTVGADEFNHKEVDGDMRLIIYAQSANSQNIALNTRCPAGDFFTVIKLDGAPTDKFSLNLAGHSSNGETPLDLKYAKDTSFWAVTTESYKVLTIPKDATLYNIKFAAEMKLYFYNGKWQLDRPYDPAIDVTTEATGITVGADEFNHKEVDGDMRLIIYAQSANSQNIALNTRCPAGDFFTVIKLDGETTDKFSIRLGTHSSNGETPLDLKYAKDTSFWAVTTESYKVLTIPKDATLYNIKFAAEMKLYFYNGKWQLTEPVLLPTYDPETDKMTEVTAVEVEPVYNHVVSYDKLCLVLYAKAEGQNVSLKVYYPEGNFFTVIKLDGEATDKFTLRLGKHSGNDKTPLDLVYEEDNAFWTSTNESYKVLTIPKDATLYNLKFASEVKLYFYEGKWQLQKPVVAEEQSFIEVSKSVLHPSYNHEKSGNYRDTILYFYTDTIGDYINLNYGYPVGTLEDSMKLYDAEGNVIEGANLTVATAGGHMGDGKSPVHFRYDDNETLWAVTNQTYIELRLPKDATLFNLKLKEDVSLYFYNGLWQNFAPVLDYKIDEEHLDTFTLGEVLESKLFKGETFKMGERGIPGSGIIADSISSPLLSSNNYELIFKMKIESDYYRIGLILNGSASNLWSGIGLEFWNTEKTASTDAVQGIYLLDNINPYGKEPAYFINKYCFEKNVEYSVRILVALDEEDRGALLRLVVDNAIWGEMFIPANGGLKMSQIMGSRVLLVVDNGQTDGYYGTAEFTNIDRNAPVVSVENNNTKIEAGQLAEGFRYPVTVVDGIDGEVDYTASIMSGELESGRFKAGETYVVRFTARDKKGNETVKDISFECLYDITPPVISFSALVNDGTIEIAMGSNAEEILRLIGASATDNKSSNVTLTHTFRDGMFDENGGLAKGRFLVVFRAEDESHNVTEVTLRVIAVDAVEEEGKGCSCKSSVSLGNVLLAAGALLAAAAVIVLVRRKKND